MIVKGRVGFRLGTYRHHYGTHTLGRGTTGGPEIEAILEVGDGRLRHKDAWIHRVLVTLNQAGSTLRLLNYLLKDCLFFLQGKRERTLLPTGREERGVLGVGRIPVAILPLSKLLHYNCITIYVWVVQ